VSRPEPFFRQRLPFLGLFLAAAVGILVSSATGIPSFAFLGLAAAAGIAWTIFPKTPLVLLAVGLAFGCVHTWQSRESPAWRLADRLRAGPELATASGTVLTDPAAFGSERERIALRISGLEIDGQAARFPCDLDVVVPAPAPPRGATIRVTGRLEVIPPPRNPGAFDARTWMRSRGITTSLAVASGFDVEVLSLAPWYALPSLASRSRTWMEETLKAGISNDPVVSNLIVGMALGVTSSLPEQLQEDFRNTGTFHLFSVSGLHVGMIGLILWQVLKLTGLRRSRAVAVIIPALFFYTLVTGWKPSSIRAAVMASIFLIGLTSSRQPMAFNSLCAAGFFILVQWTTELFNPGFQLSFLVVAAILFLAGPLHDLLRRHLHPDTFVPRQIWTAREKMTASSAEYFGGLAAVSLAAWAGSLPLTLIYFHLVSLSALPANFVIVPLAFLIMATACAALAGGLVSLWLAAVFNNANWVFTKLLLVIVQAAVSVPGSHFYVGLPASAPVVVTVFDFGSGGGAAVESDRKIALFDCGPQRHLESVLRPWLRSRGREAPDILLVSHGDAGHIGGGIGFLDSSAPPKILESMVDDRSPVRGRFHAALAAQGAPKSLLRTGDHIPLFGQTSLDILHPSPGQPGTEADDKVLVVRLHAGPARILFLADAGMPTQARLLESSRGRLEADVLVAGIPSSGIPMSDEFLDAVRPGIVIITGTEFPASQIPDPDWCDRVASRGIELFRQDVSGAVQIECDLARIRASGYLDGRTIIRHASEKIHE